MVDKPVSYRHNIMNINSIDTFLSVKGGFNNKMRDVYFVRATGECAGYRDVIINADQRMGAEESAGRMKYSRIGKLPVLCGMEDTNSYSGIYDEWKNSGRISLKNISVSGELAQCISFALTDTICIYREVKKEVSDSMARNFASKLLFWMDSLPKTLFDGWTHRSCIKILAENVIKEQEYLFFYFITMIGCDVLLLENQKDAEVSDSLKNLSQTLQLGEYGTKCLPEYVPYVPHTSASQHAQIPPVPQQSAQPPVQTDRRSNVKVVIPERSRVREVGAGTRNNIGSAGGRNNTASAGVSASNLEQRTVINTSVQSPGAGTAGREKSFEELAQMASSIVMITVHDRNGDVMGTGSGIMIGRDGYILTNNHVISKGSFYSVRIEGDDKIYPTDEIIKYNYNLDLAVMRISRTLAPLPIYRGAHKLARGQKVVAIGSPLGLFNSVSDGIISGFRDIDNVDMIQFTAPISPGSSGGAVLNMLGEVIGISTAGFDRGQNINLAVGYESILMFAKGFYGA